MTIREQKKCPPALSAQCDAGVSAGAQDEDPKIGKRFSVSGLLKFEAFVMDLCTIC